MVTSFLLEIGSEEIPARFVRRGLEILRDALVDLLNESAITFRCVQEYGTPRRLAIVVEDIALRQRDRVVEAVGPPLKVSYDSKGSPTKAATGFAKSQGVDVDALFVKKTDRGEYVAVRKEIKGRHTKEILGESLPQLLRGLQLPKSMRWGHGELRFFRPIHWIVAILGREVVEFEIDGIKSGNITYGHRFLAPKGVQIDDASLYPQVLEDYTVVPEIEKRKDMILRGIKNICGDRYLVREDSDLLHTVACLVEYPSVLMGNFDRVYLELPRELPITVMKMHQKYFCVEEKDGSLAPKFIMVSNTSPDNNDTVRRGAERVLRARLEDARFYYKQDTEKRLEEFVELLKGVVFQEKIGSLYDKTLRLQELSDYISMILGVGPRDEIRRAALLCKADLVTGVVSEFPELQGYMGMVYAETSGESPTVSRAIYEHYMPRYVDDTLPETSAGAIVSIADKIDNIVAFYYLGMIPTGSEDPFALRRQAAGIINIIVKMGYEFDLEDVIERAFELLGVSEGERTPIFEQVVEFFRIRLETVFTGMGYPRDTVECIIHAGRMNIGDMTGRIRVLSEIMGSAGFDDLLTAAKRVYNILSDSAGGVVNEALLSEEEERELYRISGEVRKDLHSSGYRALFSLTGPINRFFDRVLVMDRDEKVRGNRLALLAEIRSLFNSLGDFSRLNR